MDISIDSVVKHFGTREAAARFFGISRQAVYQWGDGNIPRERALELMVRLPDVFGASAAKAAA